MINRTWAVPALLYTALFLPIAGCERNANRETPHTDHVDLVGWMGGGVDEYLTIPGWGIDSDGTVTVTGQHGMVTGTNGALATRAGVETLKAGGTAMDAAISTALSQIALTGGAFISYAGWWTMIYYDAANDRYYSLNAGYNTVRGELDSDSIPGIDFASLTTDEEIVQALKALRTDGRAVLVPGFMAGIQAGHDRFGALPFDKLFGPAIRIAEDGIPVTEYLEKVFSDNREILSIYPATQAIFLNEAGEFLSQGDRFRQTALAGTLRNVAEQGAAYMYKSAWAKKFVTAVRAAGGKMTIQDMLDYEVIWTEPVRGRFRDYEIYAYGLPAFGGVNFVEAMRILELADLRALSDMHYESGEALFWLSKILELFSLSNMSSDELNALYDRTDLSVENRGRAETSQWIWDQIKASNGDFFKTSEEPNDETPSHSAGVVAVDQWGNVAAVVHSINTDGFGYSGLFVDGVSIPDSAWFQKGRIKQTGPGNRVPSPTNPLIVTKNGKPYLGSATIGASLHNQTVQGVYYVLEYGMSPSEAAAHPAVLSHWQTEGGIAVVRSEISDAVLQEFTELGGEYSNVENRGRYWISVAIDPETGVLQSSDAVMKDRDNQPLGLAAGY